MAQNQFINITISPAAKAGAPEIASSLHGVSRGTAAAGDLTLSFDSTKFSTVTLLRSGLMEALRIASGGLPQ